MKLTAIAQDEFVNVGRSSGMRKTTMPYIDIPFTEGLTSDDHIHMVTGAMRLLISAMGSAPRAAIVVVNKGRVN